MNILLSIRSTSDQSHREIPCTLDDPLVIGRGAEQGLLLDGPDLSREHLALGSDGTNVYVTDLSSNGTWLNGNKLPRSVKSKVRPEDSIEVPGYVLRFRLDVPTSTQNVVALSSPSFQQPAPASPAPAAPGAIAVLDPVVRFIGSFSFSEKLLILVGITGLVLFFVYFTS
jgi:predicted component of type VI protein secretion system